MTVVERLNELREQLELERAATEPGDAGREISIAITALEDATMRYNRFRAKKLGIFAIADLDKSA